MVASKRGTREVPCNRHRVLIVDNCEDIRSVLGQIVTALMPGCAVDCAANGVEAVKSFGVAHQAVLLVDVFMPGMNGEKTFTEVQKICQDRGWEEPSVVFCTAWISPNEIYRLIDQDPSHHHLLHKPIPNEDLMRCLTPHLDVRGRKDFHN